MLNGEKFRNKIIVDIAISDNGLCYIVFTKYMGFSDKDFVQTDDKIIEDVVFNWLLSDYQEPIKLSRLEYEILKYIKERDYEYIARDEDGNLRVHTEKPFKLLYLWKNYHNAALYIKLFNNLFQFVKWEDEEPTSIEEVLGNCEVKD